MAAIVVASYILKEAFEILIEAFKPLTDNALPKKEQELLKAIIIKYSGGKEKFHMFRSRKAGSNRELDFHLEVPGNMTVTNSHKLCDKIENELKEALPNLQITIHVEPEDYHQ